jgi:uncharacterized protein YxjI
MQTFEVVQKLLSFGPAYEIRLTGQTDVAMTVKGKVLTMTPKLTMVAGTDGGAVAELTANFMKTKFVITGSDGKEKGTLTFPLLQFKKSFTISSEGHEFKADGGFLGGEFKCVDAQGNPVLVIAKQLSLRDKFAVTTNGALPEEVALLSAVAIDQKFFQEEV